MKKLQCTKCTQVFWTEVKHIDENLIGIDEWIEMECPKCGEEWAIVEPKMGRKGRVPRKKRGRPVRKGIKREAGKVEQKPTPEGIKPSGFTPGQIKNLRKRLGLSQKELGILTGSSLGAVGMWERGKSKPRGDKKAALLTLQDKGQDQIKEMLAGKGQEV